MIAHWAAVLVVGLGMGGTAGPSTAFFYGRPIPARLMAHYDRVVVEADNVDAGELELLREYGTEVFAYLSVGEAEPSRSWFGDISADWIKGRNAEWGGAILDLTQPGWKRFLLDVRMRDLWERGYRGFFLDTLDSYQRLGLPAEGNALQEAGLVSIVDAMAERYAGVRIIFNRGFEILDRVGKHGAGLVAESVFQTWDPGARVFTEVSAETRGRLLERLRIARDVHGLPVTVLDYVPAARRDLMRETAGKIAALGFTPWVATPALDLVGIGSLEVVPRRVLVLYDGRIEKRAQSEAARFAAPILAHLGFAADFVDVGGVLPDFPLGGRYAGVVTWLASNAIPDGPRYQAWLLSQMKQGLGVVILDQLGFRPDGDFLRATGLTTVRGRLVAPVKLRVTSELMGFAAKPAARTRLARRCRSVASVNRVHLGVEDARGKRVDPVVTGPWGGMALGPYVIERGPESTATWIIDPFTFFREALAPEDFPVPDLTTENGRRLLITTIDRDGAFDAASFGDGEYSMGVLLREVIEKYRLPTSLSLGDGPVGGSSLLPVQAAHLAEMVQAMRLLPHVELLGAGFAQARDTGDVGDGNISRGSCDDFRRLRERLELTDRPRRLEPMKLHHDFRAGSKPASLRALADVYDWVIAQETLPVFASEYARKLEDFQRVSVARRADGGWQIHGLRDLRTTRVDRRLGWPDLERSKEVVCLRDLSQGRYLSFSGADPVVLYFGDKRPSRPHLEQLNAAVTRHKSRSTGFEATVRARVPLELVITGANTTATLESSHVLVESSGPEEKRAYRQAEISTGEIDIRFLQAEEGPR